KLKPKPPAIPLSKHSLAIYRQQSFLRPKQIQTAPPSCGFSRAKLKRERKEVRFRDRQGRHNWILRDLRWDAF
ncbi:hypothetical protein QQP08_008260, partial [Theobroma cacao]